MCVGVGGGDVGGSVSVCVVGMGGGGGAIIITSFFVCFGDGNSVGRG